MNKLKWQICVCCAIRFENEYLLLKRSTDEDVCAGFWEMPSGRLEFGETVKQGLKRETFEEIGLDISYFDEKIVGISEYINNKNDETIYFVQLNYVVDVPTKCLPIKLSNEHTSYVWATKDSEYIDNFIAEIIDAIEVQDENKKEKIKTKNEVK